MYNQRYQRPTLVILLLLLSVAFAGPCLGSSNDLLQSGIESFSNLRSSNREQCRKVDINFIIPSNGIQVTVSLSLFQYDLSQGLDYSLRGTRLGTANQIYLSLLIQNDARWSSLRVSYFASSRSDFWVGMFIAGNINILQFLDLVAFSTCTNNRTSLLSTQVSGMISNFSIGLYNSSSTFLIQPMISGIRTQNSQVALSLTASINIQLGVLNVNINNAVVGIELLSIGYVIILTPQPSYNLRFFNYPTQPSNGDYLSVGVTSYSNGLPTFLGLELKGNQQLTCIGPICSISCITITQCTALNGTILNNNTCLSCFPTQTYSNGQCNCPVDQVLVNNICVCKPGFVNVQGTCINLCGINQNWNGTACVCNIGFAKYNGAVCSPCPSGSISSADYSTCICNQGTIFDSITVACLQNNCPANSQPVIQSGVVKCVCGVGFYQPAPVVCLQIPSCPPTSTWNPTTFKCVCNTAGYTIVNNVCTAPTPTCPTNSTYNPTSNTCQCTNINEVYVVGLACTCRNNFVRTNGICNNCPSTATVSLQNNALQCTCPNNQVILQNPTNSQLTCGCSSGFALNNAGSCYQIPSCPPDATLSATLPYTCICNIPSYTISNNHCCPPNATWIAALNSCQCNTVNAYIINSVCTLCGINQVYSATANGCICISGFTRTNAICNDCPSTAVVSLSNGLVVCTCPQNQTIFTVNNVKTCGCPSGYYIDSTTKNCLLTSTILSCPANSTFSQSQSKCICTNTNENLINNQCQACQANSAYNGNACVCSFSYFSINSICRTCDINTFYTGSDCVCNLGFYGNRDFCAKCDLTCGRCLGSAANQCITCADISYQLINNSICAKQAPCVKGMYVDTGFCFPCSNYCADCISLTVCNSCVLGFSLGTTVIDATTSVIACNQICGDGRRFTLACDDGNTRNGDGCSSTCQIQSGFACSSGTPTAPSLCSAITTAPSATIITKGKVNTFGKILMGVTVAYLPANLTQNDCAQCSQVLFVQVYQSTLIQSITVEYQPSSNFKFVVQFDFNGVVAIPPFVVTVQLNPALAGYFTVADMAQKLQFVIDPSTLSLVNSGSNGALDLSTFGLTTTTTNNNIDASSSVKNGLFGP